MAHRGNYNNRGLNSSGWANTNQTNNPTNSYQNAAPPNSNQNATPPNSNQLVRSTPNSYQNTPAPNSNQLVRSTPQSWNNSQLAHYNPTPESQTREQIQRDRQQNYDMAQLIVKEYAKALRRSTQTGSIRPSVNVHQRRVVGTFEDTHEAFCTLEEQYDQLEEQYAQPITRRANRIEAAPTNDSRPLSDPYRRGQDNTFEHDSNSYNELPNLNRASTSNQNPSPTPNTPQPTPEELELAAYDLARANVEDFAFALSRSIEYGYLRPPVNNAQHRIMNMFEDTCEEYRAIVEKYDQLEAEQFEPAPRPVPRGRLQAPAPHHGAHCSTCTCDPASQPQSESARSPRPMNQLQGGE